MSCGSTATAGRSIAAARCSGGGPRRAPKRGAEGKRREEGREPTSPATPQPTRQKTGKPGQIGPPPARGQAQHGERAARHAPAGKGRRPPAAAAPPPPGGRGGEERRDAIDEPEGAEAGGAEMTGGAVRNHGGEDARGKRHVRAPQGDRRQQASKLSASARMRLPAIRTPMPAIRIVRGSSGR